MEKTYDPIEEQYNKFKEDEERKKLPEKKNVTYDVKNYLSTRLSHDEKSKDLKIRIIGFSSEESDGNTPFREVHTHYFKTANKTFTCLKETKNLPDDKTGDCPFCDIMTQAEKEQKTANDIEWKKLKDIRNQNTPQKNFIVRLIDRDDQSFGVKFWRLNAANYKMIYAIYKLHKAAGIDIYDEKTGKDLIITIEKENGKSKIKQISADVIQRPLSENQTEIDSLLNDTKKWYEVYGVKSYEYLTLVINGEEPYFDKGKNEWVSKRKHFAEKEAQEEQDNDTSQEYESEFTNENPVTNSSDDEDGDLPF